MLAIALLCLLVRLGLAQKTPVFVTASFQDRNGLFVENLTSAEVQVFENGHSRAVELFARDELPTVYGLIFQRAVISQEWVQQRSGLNQAPGVASPRDLAYELVDKYLGKYPTWVGAYDAETATELEPAADGFAVKDAIQRLQEVRRPEPFLYSALFTAVQKMSERTERRRVLLVFLDFVDMKTSQKLQTLKNLLSSSNVELFTISFATRLATGSDGQSAPLNQSTLRDLARVTSGDAFFAADYRDHMEDISRRILNQIRTFYTIGFQSEASADKGAKLLVSCTRPGVKVKHHPTVPVLQ